MAVDRRMILMIIVLASLGAIGGAAPTDPWRSLATGLEHAHFEVDAAVIEVLRIDPEHWETVALAVSDVGGDNRTMDEWAREFDLAAAINAGMFATDLRTHTGYFHTGNHVNNSHWVQRDYRQAACFEPRRADLPRFRLEDLDAVPESTFVHDYDIVVQNIRLVRRPGENRWHSPTRRWSEAGLGEDSQGRILWFYCRHPLDMHTLNEILLDLPLDLTAAQHLEGGSAAQMWIGTGERALMTGSGVSVPNILGIRPRQTVSEKPSSSP